MYQSNHSSISTLELYIYELEHRKTKNIVFLKFRSLLLAGLFQRQEDQERLRDRETAINLTTTCMPCLVTSESIDALAAFQRKFIHTARKGFVG